jgi:hypothetical protein
VNVKKITTRLMAVWGLGRAAGARLGFAGVLRLVEKVRAGLVAGGRAGAGVMRWRRRGEDAGVAGSREPALRKPLVAPRPATLEQRYELVEGTELTDVVFRRLQRRLYEAADGKQAPRTRVRRAAMLREAGRIGGAPPRPYFFLKPLDRTGWLFERSDTGWVVARADKITERDLFLRRGEAVDVATLFVARDSAGFPRVRSPLFGGELLALAVYEQKLIDHLGLQASA